MFALYAYMRLVDDIADDDRSAEQRSADLGLRMPLVEEHLAGAQAAEIDDGAQHLPAVLGEGAGEPVPGADHHRPLAEGRGDDVVRLVGAAVEVPLALPLHGDQDDGVAPLGERLLVGEVVGEAATAEEAVRK